MMYEKFPDIEPYADGFLDLDGQHKMYWQQSGNPNGIPVVVLHGGPGAGLNPEHRRYFDPNAYRIIAYDQRGAGRSVPSGLLKNNTAAHLVDDLDALRRFLNIEKWIVTGSSWGSTLTLLYAQKYPETCLALVPRSIFLDSREESNWLERSLPYLFPDAFEALGEITLPQLKQKILSTDTSESQKAADLYFALFSQIGRIKAQPYDPAFPAPASLARIEAHFHSHHLFLEDRQILKNMHKIKSIPGTILHGRYDMICPIKSAFDLSNAWDNAELIVVADAGHSNSEGEFPERLVKVFETLKLNFC